MANKNYAVILNNVVSNVIVADSINLANMIVKATNPDSFCVECPTEPVLVGFNYYGVGVGWGYEDGEFIPPIKPEPIKVKE
jgi:hypothetical protein